MKLRLFQFSLGPGKLPVAKKIAAKAIPLIRSQKGCRDAEFFGDHKTGDYGIVVFWASGKDADAAASVIGPVLMPTVKQAGGEPEVRLFDVYEPE